MDITLFLGHGKTEMRGGPAIFTSIYSQWPDRNKYIIYEKSYIQSARKLFALVKNKKLSILIFENEYFTEVILAVILKLLNRKLNIYGPAYHIPSPPKLGKDFFNSLIHYIDYKLGLLFMAHIYSGIYTENSYMKNYITAINPKQNVIVESPGIKDEAVLPLLELRDSKRDIDFLYLTSMTKNKGIYDFLGIALRLQKSYPDIKICIAGYASPDILGYINKLVMQRDINNLEVYSDISDAEKYKLYLRSKIYVLPSIEDGIPITFYEAWSYGNIVIAYNLETYSDITEYFIGAKTGNVEELIAKCEYVYKNYNVYFNKSLEKSYNYSVKHSYENGIKNIIKGIKESSNSINQVR